MSISERVRSAEFRMAYWERAEELVRLMDVSGKARAAQAARAAGLGRKTLKRFNHLAETTPAGPLSIDEADVVIQRYAFWAIRRKFDWGSYPPGVDMVGCVGAEDDPLAVELRGGLLMDHTVRQ